ncbi:MAG: OsmC family protein [Bryobacterales bacterium]|nr:OsmC family protein [Bryobacterales bacterium]
MEVRVQYQNGVLFEATARSRRVLCNQPLSNRGTDQGMTPREFLLTPLATCAGYYAAEYLRARKLPVAGAWSGRQAPGGRRPGR